MPTRVKYIKFYSEKINSEPLYGQKHIRHLKSVQISITASIRMRVPLKYDDAQTHRSRTMNPLTKYLHTCLEETFKRSPYQPLCLLTTSTLT